MKKIIALTIMSMMILTGCANSESPTVISTETTTPGFEPNVTITEPTDVSVTESTIGIGGVEPMMPPTESSEAIVLDEGMIDEELVGTWSYSLDTTTFSYVFYNDGTGGIIVEDVDGYYDDSAEFNYSADGETLIMDMAPNNEEIEAIQSYTYTITEDTLVLSDDYDEILEFTR